jgi:electron transport complex protein RnfG
MKIVFKINHGLAALALAVSLGAGSVAHADQVYFTPRDLLADFFRASRNVTYKKVQLSDGDKARLAHRLGYALRKPSYTFYVASSGSHVDGFAFLDDEMGEHQPISFAVKLSPEGRVERQEIVVYREPRGDEVRDERFRRQFVGKSARDPIVANEDIVVVSGATISSRAVATGVKRAVVLFDELVKPTLSATARR